MSIQISLPWPPSGNHMYTVARGRKILSADGRHYRTRCGLLIMAHRRGSTINGKVKLHILANVPDRRKRDLDNLVKMPIDCVVIGGVIADDSQIDLLIVERGPVSKEPGLVVTIEALA